MWIGQVLKGEAAMVQMNRAAGFAEIEDAFLRRVNSVVWCNVATVDRHGRPRSRILHPYWEGRTGWIATAPNTLKAKHLLNNPYVSLAYVADIAKPVYADCTAAWVGDPAVKEHVWNLFRDAPPPLGYDPAPIFHALDHPRFGVLKLTPWRIEVATIPTSRIVWHAAER